MSEESGPLLGGTSASRSSKPSRVRDYLLGVTLLLLVVGLWTLGSFITSDIETGDYNKPWLLTYLGTASFSLYLLRPATRKLWASIQAYRRSLCAAPLLRSDEQHYSAPSHHHPETDSESDVALHSTWSNVPSVHPRLSSRQTASLALEFCVLWFLANYTLSVALSWTSVSSVTILSATSGLFALVLGHLLGFSAFSAAKLAAVLISLLGVTLVSLSDSEVASSPDDAQRPTHPLWGDLMALLSAVFYACYVSLVKLRAGDESRLDMPYFLGLVGAINIVLLWPVGLILHLTNVEPFELPSSRSLVLAIFINSMITFTSDFFYLVAMLLTSPLIVTLGLSLTIPLAVAGDLLLGHVFGGFKAAAGAVLVVASFIIVGFADSEESTASERHEHAP